MPPQAGSRKRPAPGSSPDQAQVTMQDQQNQQLHFAAGAPLTDDEFLRWGQAGAGAVADPYGTGAGLAQPLLDPSLQAPQQPVTSTQLTRRAGSQQLVTRGQRQLGDDDAWGDYPDALQLDTRAPAVGAEDDMDELLERAQVAKREAMARRKQIPPFVQKLSRCAAAPSDGVSLTWPASSTSRATRTSSAGQKRATRLSCSTRTSSRAR